MAQFNLPLNSRPKPGKTWPKTPAAKRTTEFRIHRPSADEVAGRARRGAFAPVDRGGARA
jgi:hypothetical protein